MDKKFSCQLDEHHVERNLKDLIDFMKEELSNEYQTCKYVDDLGSCCKWIIYPKAWDYIEGCLKNSNSDFIDVSTECTDPRTEGKIFGIDFQVSSYDIMYAPDTVSLIFSRPRVDYGKYSTYNAVPRNSGRYFSERFTTYTAKIPSIKDVIFNNPATIVLWADGTKTIVKCQENDIYDEEKGLAMAIVKKLSGNKGNFNNLFKHWIGINKEEN